MKYLIIGLGIYGANLARDLTEMGHEVIGADDCQSNIESLKNYISTVYLIDSTEENQLAVLPLLNVDLVIVAIGENFGASIKTVALLKKAGVKHIYARAIDTLHEAILQSFEIDRIITPEQRAAEDLTHELELGTEVTTLKVDADNVVVNFAVQGLHPRAHLCRPVNETGPRLRPDTCCCKPPYRDLQHTRHKTHDSQTPRRQSDCHRHSRRHNHNLRQPQENHRLLQGLKFLKSQCSPLRNLLKFHNFVF